MGKVTPINISNGPDGRRTHLREIPPDFDTPLGTIGQELRGARISGGEDIGTVSSVLKIRRDHLEALENDNISALPGRTYAVGFVRAYADYLGLDPVAAVERFKTEIAGRDDTSRTAGFKEIEEEPRMGRGWIVFALIVLGLIAYGVYYLFFSPSGIQSGQPITSVPAPVVAKPVPHPAHHALPSKPATAASANPPSTAPAQIVPPATPGEAPTVAAGQGGTVYGKMNKNAHVVLRVTQPTKVLVQTEDGRAFINRVLSAGDIYQVPNMHGLALTAEHGNAVQILLDGKSVRTAGNSTAPAEAVSIDATDLTGGRVSRPSASKPITHTPAAAGPATPATAPPQPTPGGTQ
jgi:cytoskeleton protein RodZ